MTRTSVALVAAVLFVGVAGCPPEKRIVWSPDGRLAAVRAGDGLYLCDENGRLSPQVCEKARDVAWLPDSRRLLVVEETDATTWDAVEPILSEERRRALIAWAEPLRKELLAHTGTLESFEPSMHREITPGELGTLGLYVRDRRSEGLREKLGDEWDTVEKISVGLNTFRIYEVGPEGAVPGPVVLTSLDKVEELRLAPDGRCVAFATAGPGEGDGRLYVAPLEERAVPRAGGDARPTALSLATARATAAPRAGGDARPTGGDVGPLEERAAARVVADRGAAFFPDWTPDGRYLVFARTTVRVEKGAEETLRLGTISRREIRDAGGALLKEFPTVEDLAGILFDASLRVRCVADGRIVFAANEVVLPCTAKDMPQATSLYALDPNKQATLSRLTPRSVEIDLVGLSYFELDPTGTKVALADSNSRVRILDLATGVVNLVQPDEESGDTTRVAPVWRSADQLCFRVPPSSKMGSARRAEIVLWSPQGSTCLSHGWSGPDVDGFLTAASGDKAAATQP